MKFDPQKHHRQSIRLRGHDYAQAGAYFVTICTFQREHLFGKIVGGQMRLNEYGQIVVGSWQWLSDQYSYVDLDSLVVISSPPIPNANHWVV